MNGRAAIAAIVVNMLVPRSRGFYTTHHRARGLWHSTTVLLAKKTKTTLVRKGDFWQARMDQGVWRPTVNDVERIGWGKPAKRKGTGSRGVPHRLNEQERATFDRARQKGFLQVTGSAWRSQRRDAPLLNTYRSLCDAHGQACIVLHKGASGLDDLVVDLSPLRNPDEFDQIASHCLGRYSGGRVVSPGSGLPTDSDDNVGIDEDDGHDEDQHNTSSAENPWESRPIYHLPPHCIVWDLVERSEAKALGKTMSELFDTVEGKRAVSKKPIGVKPGKSRRHGGYGIG